MVILIALTLPNHYRFILPCLLVISNDIFAYIFGIFYGKRRLIELSPKKTIEGFIGGMFSTIAFAFIVRRFFLTAANFVYSSLVCLATSSI